LGLSGILNSQKNKLIKSPNLRNWENKNIVKVFSSKFKCPVFLKNDADLEGLGESIFGAGKKYNIVAYLCLGTGVGGTRITNKKIDYSCSGFEPGHQIINFKGKYWPYCRQKGCLESYISGKAFEKIYKIRPKNCSDTKIWAKYGIARNKKNN